MAEREVMAKEQAVADRPKEFWVFIRSSFMGPLQVPVSLDDTVWELKVKIRALSPYRYSTLGMLFHGNRLMEDRRTLRHYEITPNSSLYYRENYAVYQAPLDFQAQSAGSILPRRQSMEVPHKPWPFLTPWSTEESDDPPVQEFERKLNLGSPLQEKSLCCVRESLPEVTPEISQEKNETVYRAHLPAEGTFQCSITRLGFKVKSAVTITYRYAPWTTHLSMGEQEVWKPVGPLFHIEVQAGVVQAVHLPHFVCMAEVKNTAWCYIAHFQSGKITLETPTKVTSFSAVLENPSFSLVGVLWRKFRYTFKRGFLPVHSLVLIFQQLSAARTTLHLYLIPDDNSVKQAIEKQEMNWNSKLIPKPPPFHRLFIGHSYLVTSKASVVIMPEAEFPFWYKSPRRQQLFLEIYIRKMEEEIELLIIDTENDTEVWKALVRSGDIDPPVCIPENLPGAAFLKMHKTELCSRMSQLDAVLLRLRDMDVINSDEEEEVRGHNTSQRRNRALLELVEKKGLEAQELLFQILRDRDPFLISDLEAFSEHGPSRRWLFSLLH